MQFNAECNAWSIQKSSSSVCSSVKRLHFIASAYQSLCGMASLATKLEIFQSDYICIQHTILLSCLQGAQFQELFVSHCLYVRVLTGDNVCFVISRPGRSQGLLYKQPLNQLIHSFIQSLILFLPQFYGAATPERLEIDLPVIKYVLVIKTFVNPKGHQNPINGSKVTAILLKGLILPVGGASVVEGLQSTRLLRLVSINCNSKKINIFVFK